MSQAHDHLFGNIPSVPDEEKAFDAWFREFSSWGLGHEQLLRCSFVPGDGEGDEVYTSPDGHVMTRYMCRRWLDFYSAARVGWNASRKPAR